MTNNGKKISAKLIIVNLPNLKTQFAILFDDGKLFLVARSFKGKKHGKTILYHLHKKN